MLRSRKLAKLELNEVVVDLAYVSALERVLMINPKSTAVDATEEAKAAAMQATGGQ